MSNPLGLRTVPAWRRDMRGVSGITKLIHWTLIALFISITPLSLANRARFWWQELVVNYALVLVLPSVFAFCYLCFQKLPGRIGLLITTLCGILTAYHILFVGKLLYPYASILPDNRVSSMPATSQFSLGYLESFSTWSDVSRFAEQSTSDIVIIQDFPKSYEGKVSKLFRETYFISKGDATGILVASQYPIIEVVSSDLGILSHPGGAIRIKIAEGFEPLLGVMALESSVNADIFERNRVTSRRMASILRNTPGYRLAFLRLASAPFSQFAYVFQEQTDMKSFLYDIGLGSYLHLGKRYGFGSLDNMYHSPDMKCVTTRDNTISGSPWRFFCSADIDSPT